MCLSKILSALVPNTEELVTWCKWSRDKSDLWESKAYGRKQSPHEILLAGTQPCSWFIDLFMLQILIDAAAFLSSIM